MKIEIDTHSHTLVSGHAYNTLREMAHMAAEKGLKGLAVTEKLIEAGIDILSTDDETKEPSDDTGGKADK